MVHHQDKTPFHTHTSTQFSTVQWILIYDIPWELIDHGIMRSPNIVRTIFWPLDSVRKGVYNIYTTHHTLEMIFTSHSHALRCFIIKITWQRIRLQVISTTSYLNLGSKLLACHSQHLHNKSTSIVQTSMHTWERDKTFSFVCGKMFILSFSWEFSGLEISPLTYHLLKPPSFPTGLHMIFTNPITTPPQHTSYLGHDIMINSLPWHNINVYLKVA